jgi:hypothetical protein
LLSVAWRDDRLPASKTPDQKIVNPGLADFLLTGRHKWGA